MMTGFLKYIYRRIHRVTCPKLDRAREKEKEKGEFPEKTTRWQATFAKIYNDHRNAHLHAAPACSRFVRGECVCKIQRRSSRRSTRAICICRSNKNSIQVASTTLEQEICSLRPDAGLFCAFTPFGKLVFRQRFNLLRRATRVENFFVPKLLYLLSFKNIKV